MLAYGQLKDEDKIEVWLWDVRLAKSSKWQVKKDIEIGMPSSVVVSNF